MSWDWNMNTRLKTFTAKAAATAMATLLFTTQVPGLTGGASAAQAEAGSVNETVSGENDQLDVTSKDVPEGAKISSRQAADNILKLFPVLKKATISSANFDVTNSYPPPDYKAWDIGFQMVQGNHSMGFSASVHAGTGEVLSVHLPSEFVESQLPSAADVQLTKEEAEKTALELLHQAIPGLKEGQYVPLGEQYSPMEQQALFGRTQYQFVYNLKQDGVISDAETVYISVDERGQATSYSRSTISAKYPSSKPKASEEQARKVFEDGFDVELAYISKENLSSRQVQQYVLGYLPKGDSMGAINANTLDRIDVLTGKAVDKSNSPHHKKVTGNVPAFTAASGQRLNVQQAVERVAASFDIPKDYKLEHSQLTKGYYGNGNNQVWSLSWSNRNANISYMFMRDISAQVDAVTGQVYSYNMMQRVGPEMIQKQPSQEKESKTVTLQQAEKLAMNTIIATVPQAKEQYQLASIIEIDDARTFVFQRYVNGIRVQDDTAQVQVKNNGNIPEFYTRLAASPEQLPIDTKPAIRYEEAKELYLKKYTLTLNYARYGGYGLGSSEPAPVGVNLAYVPVSGKKSLYNLNELLDASTGQWFFMYGVNHAESQVEPTDIAGHVAESALRNMTKHKVLLVDEQERVLPDRVITRGDWFNYLARAINPNMDMYYSSDSNDKLFADVTIESPYYKAVKVLMDQRWIGGADPEKQLKPEEEMTREELAVVLMRILRYEKLAGFYMQPSDLPNIADASAINNKGAVSLSLKLGLLPSIEGRFMPARKVTVAEASQVLERLAKLQGKTDTFMSGSRLY
ncbi:YcdB/YcdC domain-containing protein [Paenibacillus sp. TSA_86.1]|uniref:YcdB/YcdC domain-containing protein n=1 Tax=Paenibacillus sp. TSA_86.1 TaxID=3415649 RepID=UPI004045EA4D